MIFYNTSSQGSTETKISLPRPRPLVYPRPRPSQPTETETSCPTETGRDRPNRDFYKKCYFFVIFDKIFQRHFARRAKNLLLHFDFGARAPKFWNLVVLQWNFEPKKSIFEIFKASFPSLVSVSVEFLPRPANQLPNRDRDRDLKNDRDRDLKNNLDRDRDRDLKNNRDRD